VGTVHLRDDDDWESDRYLHCSILLPCGRGGMNLYQDSGMINPNGAGCRHAAGDSAWRHGRGQLRLSLQRQHTLPEPSGATLVSSGGLSTYKLHLGSEALTAAPRGEQNIFLPRCVKFDVDGRDVDP